MGYRLFPPITTLHFFGLQPFASRCKQPLSSMQLTLMLNSCKLSATHLDAKSTKRDSASKIGCCTGRYVGCCYCLFGDTVWLSAASSDLSLCQLFASTGTVSNFVLAALQAFQRLPKHLLVRDDVGCIAIVTSWESEVSSRPLCGN